MSTTPLSLLNLIYESLKVKITIESGVINIIVSKNVVQKPYQVMLENEKPEDWAEVLSRNEVQQCVFYTPLLSIFCQTESFKRRVHLFRTFSTKYRDDLARYILSFKRVPNQRTQMNLKTISATGTALNTELEDRIKGQFVKYQKVQPAIGQIYGSPELNIGGMASSWSPKVDGNSVRQIYKITVKTPNSRVFQRPIFG